MSGILLYVTLILSLVIVAYLIMVAGFERMPVALPLNREQLLLAGTGINVLLVLLAFLFKPSGLVSSAVGWRFGAFVGLIAAVAAVLPLAAPNIVSRGRS